MASDLDAVPDLPRVALDRTVWRDAADEAFDSRGRFAAIVVKLLDNAGRTLNSDRETAIACIARASALLQAERDRHAVGAKGMPAMPARGER